MKAAQLHVDAQDLAVWMVRHFDASGMLDRRLVARVLDLVEHVAHALQGLDRRTSVEEADRSLASVRVLLQLAFACERLTDRQVLHVHERVDGIGRQIGGWLRRLDRGTSEARRR